MIEYYQDFWRNWCRFKGRTRRAAYWNVILFHVLCTFGLMFLNRLFFMPKFVIHFLSLYFTVCIVPMLSMGARRLHDTGRSAWWLLLHLMGPFGVVVLLIFFSQSGTYGANQYGPDPKSN